MHYTLQRPDYVTAHRNRLGRHCLSKQKYCSRVPRSPIISECSLLASFIAFAVISALMKTKKNKTKRVLRGLNEALARSTDLKRRRYTVPDLKLLTEMSPRQVRHWEEIGLLVPSFRDESSRGNQHAAFYSSRDVVKALMIREMMKRGLSLKAIRKLATNLNERDLRMDECVKYILTDGNTVCYAESPSRIVDILKNNKQMLLICMHERVQEMKKKIRSAA
jgi:DNA-binding transcriptional MerR regulator